MGVGITTGSAVALAVALAAAVGMELVWGCGPVMVALGLGSAGSSSPQLTVISANPNAAIRTLAGAARGALRDARRFVCLLDMAMLVS